MSACGFGRWGVIPIGKREILYFTCEGGSLGAKRLRMQANAIELPAGGAAELVQILRNAQLAATGTAKSTIESDEPTEGVFDADAAIARYLASKEATQNAPTNPVPVTPQRPVFGRRQA